MILGAFLRSIAQMRDPAFRRVFWLGIALAVALLFAMYALLLMVVQIFTPDSLTLPLVGEVTGLGKLLSIASIFFMLGLSVFLMAPVASAFTGLFLDDVAAAVEARHYPALPPAKGTDFMTSLMDSLRYFALLVALNLLGMIAFVVSGGVGILVFWAINGFLLSREYFIMVALRRLPADQAHALLSRHRGRLWLAGVLMAMPLSVPIVNLTIPLLGSAVFTHLFHRLTSEK
jgi:CysZ protein